jgi:class 3 adenylate cyclase/tetratricopeptide (TPR) repeat protein
VAIGAHRKVVTVLFCDVVGSTSLGESVDPEALQGLLARYFERMQGIVESHGGSVEKFIGDAVMAVFGVPVAHEDDALRACRAAVEMRDALPELGVEGRIGANTGEVLAGTEERLATGDAVNVAARLEQAAEPGEVLIGAETLALVEATVEVGEERHLELKGKSEPVAAHPLITIRDASERSHAARFVGRGPELRQLEDVGARALAGSRCELVTVVGEPGVGKSRLVAEALVRSDAPVVRGRCLPYGEGITYWPVVEVVKSLGALPTDPAAAAAIRALLGESEQGTSADQIAWAFRKLLEEHAPLVVVFDDIQWGEDTFLDLIEATALLSAAPLFLVCMARPELLDRRSAWPGVVRLEPLSEEEADALIRGEVSTELGDRIAQAAGGNPLFLSEMLAMAREHDDVGVPPTLKALLAARLDQLEGAERHVLERGSVEGELFHRGAVQALAPDEPHVTARLTALVRRELLRPDRALLAGDDGFRFRHLLIRDAAYEALPKSVRADLHERFASWLVQHAELVELDELVGYHLEQAVRYRGELGAPAEELALRAGDRLAAAGRRALWREDRRAARGLLERALELTRPLRLDVLLEVDLSETLGFADVHGAVALLERAAQSAEAAGDATGEAFARAMAASHRHQLREVTEEELEGLLQAVIPLLERAGDYGALVHVYAALADSEGKSNAERARLSERALESARLAGQQRTGLFRFELALVSGPMPAQEALELLDSVLPEVPTPYSLFNRALLLAMLDRGDEAWVQGVEANARQRELDGTLLGEWRLAEIALIAGDPETAAAHLRELCSWFEERNWASHLSGWASRLARVLCAPEQYEEAVQWAQRGRELGDEDLWMQAQALVESHRGSHQEAERLAREGVAALGRTDSVNQHADACWDLAEVLLAAGRADEAAAVLRDALDLYEGKQNIPMARRVREKLAALELA